MSKSYQDEQEFIYSGELSCQCALTLGEKSDPVLSNIIDVSPLFYVEANYDDEFEDEFLELEQLRAELTEAESHEDILAKQSRARQASKHVDSYGKTSTEDLFLKNKNDMFAQASQNDVNAIVAAVSKSRLGKSLLDKAEEFGISIEASSHVANVLYDRGASIIRIQKTLNEERAVLGLVKALRQMWMHKKGYLIHPLCFQPEDAILLNRLRAADSLSIMCRVAWEMKLEGYETSWNELIGGNAYDLASAFARESVADFRALTSGKANLACFEAWFLSGRCKVADKELIQQMLADQHGIVFENEEISRTASYEIIAGLGELPYGKNYLSSITAQIAEDPLYAEIRDRSNANFLWFIKFERSFRESEQELQKDSGISRGSSPSSQAPDKDRDNEKREPTIIEFKAEPTNAGNSGSRAIPLKPDDMATIYYLEHFQRPSQQRS